MILVDAHVHIYDCFQLSAFFDAAAKNFLEAANQSNNSEKQHITSFLLLSEGTGSNWFFKLKENETTENSTGEWTLSSTGEPYSMRLENVSDQTLYLVAGRQIVTSEKLEVLALITEKRFPDGLPLDETIATVSKSGAIPVIPWGTGKWWGRRGKILQDYLLHPSAQPFFLGDNGGRPSFWHTPLLLRFARQRGIQVLPGSDPLPFPLEQTKAGRFGCSLQGTIIGDRPASSLRQLLIKRDKSLTPYGPLEKPAIFIRNQLAMLAKKHLRN